MQNSAVPQSLMLHASTIRKVPFFSPEAGPGSPAAGHFEEGEALQITKAWKGRTDEWYLARSQRDSGRIGWLPRSECLLEYYVPIDTAPMNDLGLQVLSDRAEFGRNLVVSPYGLGRLTAVLLAATQGKSHEKLRSLFPVWKPGDQGKAIASPVFTSIDFLLKRPEISLASSFQEFAASFRVGIQQTHFDEPSRTTVNATISQLTDGMIPAMFGSSDWSLDLKVVVVNANCFLGKWKTAFLPDFTTVQPFHVNSKKTISVSMMNAELSCRAFESRELQVEGVVLPFENSDEEAVIIMPQPEVTLESLLPRLSSTKIDGLVQTSNDMRINLSLPKFEFENLVNIFDVVPQLQPLRDPNVNLSGLTNDPDVVVSKVVQKSRIEVSESGVRAASAAAVSFGASALCEAVTPIRQIVFDRPFLFCLRHTESKALLFGCRVTNPE